MMNRFCNLSKSIGQPISPLLLWLSWVAASGIALGAPPAPSIPQAKNDLLRASHWQHLEFSDLAPTSYASQAEANSWHITVNRSASAMVLPFSEPRLVQQVSFLWQHKGEIKGTTSASERTKGGDDAYLRVGLMISGKAPSIPFFAPTWIKSLGKILKAPTNRLIYLTPGLKTPAGQVFKSPYADSISTWPVSSSPEGEWQRVHQHFKDPLSIVGVWVMADGDNTGSSFSSQIKNLQLQ
jgi:hypothetical protein